MIHSVSDLLYHTVNHAPDKKAVFYKNEFLTYAEIFEQSQNLAQTLIRVGVMPGDRVCFYLEKRPEKIISLFAIALVQAIFVPIRRLSLPRQALYIVHDSTASVLITTSSALATLSGQLKRLRCVILVDQLDFVFTDCLYLSWDEAIGSQSRRKAFSRSVSTATAAIMYTSGSTGFPKGVVLSNLNIIAGARIVSDYQKMREDDKLLSILTFGFDYGLNQLMLTFFNCSQIYLLNYLFPKDILEFVTKHQLTGLAAVATTWIQLLQIPWGDSMSSLRYITNTGGSIPVDYVRELRKRIPRTNIYLMYGLTEAFRSTFLDPTMVDKRPSSIGKAIPGEEIIVLGDDNQPVLPGQTGELVHRGVLVAQGYWNAPELTQKRFRKNPLQNAEINLDEKVVYSGDYVRQDSEGYLYFVGRKDEMIKSAGNRISPTEVEEILYNSNMIADVVAFGVPHEIYGQCVCIIASPVAGTELKAEEILQFCRKNMPVYMVPQHCLIWSSLPCNANGKLDRSTIKNNAIQQLDLCQ